MSQPKYAVLICALAAASLTAVGCQQRNASDKVGQASTPTPAPQAMQPAPAQTANNDQGTSTSSTDQSSSEAAKSTGTAAAMDDTTITSKVKPALVAEPGLQSSQIDVTTKDATVTLSGTVDSAAMRDKAKQVALSTQGVKDVVDNMNLKSTS